MVEMVHNGVVDGLLYCLQGFGEEPAQVSCFVWFGESEELEFGAWAQPKLGAVDTRQRVVHGRGGAGKV